MKIATTATVAVLVSVAGAAVGQVEGTVAALETGIIQTLGPRATDAFFNIEGEAKVGFESYGVARFDMSAARADFDATFGVGGWEVTGLRLELTQDNAGFTDNGGVDVYLTTDDAVDIKTALSPLTWPLFDASGDPDLPLANGGDPFLSYFFTETASGDVDAFDQTGGPGGAGEALNLVADLKADIENEDLLTLVFHDVDPNVAATYAGQAPRDPAFSAPTLVVTANAIGGGCYPDCDESGALDFFDFLCFQNAFAAGDLYADCDGTGALDFFDFLCFQNEFAAGCP
ncbi:MAG: hypothetical protein ACF8R7_00280 [Phycisphaerales bacterium JB039]